MKNSTLHFIGIVFVFAAQLSFGQAATDDYFAGKWDMLVVGTPGGDAKMLLTLERKDGKLIGTIQAVGNGDPVALDRVIESENSTSIYFNMSSYDISVTMQKKDDDHFTGNMLGMFDANGTRVK